jgi:hypothetical protein
VTWPTTDELTRWEAEAATYGFFAEDSWAPLGVFVAEDYRAGREVTFRVITPLPAIYTRDKGRPGGPHLFDRLHSGNVILYSELWDVLFTSHAADPATLPPEQRAPAIPDSVRRAALAYLASGIRIPNMLMHPDALWWVRINGKGYEVIPPSFRVTITLPEGSPTQQRAWNQGLLEPLLAMSLLGRERQAKVDGGTTPGGTGPG